jgi:hypothetical protein
MMDADDEMAPTKLQVTKEMMQERGAKCMLHSYLWSGEAPLATDWHTAKITDGVELYNAQAKKDGGSVKIQGGELAWRGEDDRQAQQGHIACRRWVFEQIPYDEKLPRGQDSMLVRKVLTHFGADPTSLVVIDMPLTVYHPSDHPNNEWTKKHAAPTSLALVPQTPNLESAEKSAPKVSKEETGQLFTELKSSYLTSQMQEELEGSGRLAIEKLGERLDELKARNEQAAKGSKAKLGGSVPSVVLAQSTEPQIGIVLMTLKHPRNEVLGKVLDHYLNIPLVKEIHVLWNGPGKEPPPADLLEKAEKNPQRLVVAVQEKNSLNNRWVYDKVSAPVSFYIDDDIVVEPESLQCQHSEFKKGGENLMGSFVRSKCSSCTDNHKLEGPRFCFGPCTDGFGMVVEGPWMMKTGALLKEYRSEEARPLREFVDTQSGHCDDVLMNMLWWKHKNGVTLSTAYMEASIRDDAKSAGSSLTVDPDRINARTECLEHFFGATEQVPSGFSLTQKATHALAVDDIPAIPQYTGNCCGKEGLTAPRCIAWLSGWSKGKNKTKLQT